MARNRPKLLPEKLRLAREHLHLEPTQMAQQLMSALESDNKPIEIKLHWVRNFERAKHDVDLLVLLGYSLLVKLPMDQFVDDAVSVESFRKQLQKQLKQKGKVDQNKTRKRVKR